MTTNTSPGQTSSETSRTAATQPVLARSSARGELRVGRADHLVRLGAEDLPDAAGPDHGLEPGAVRDGRRRNGGGFGLGLSAHARAMRPRDHRPPDARVQARSRLAPSSARPTVQNRAMTDLILDPDGTARCWWCGEDPLYRSYHDDEWGREKRGDDALFELLSLEGFQAGLSWLTILRKRESFRQAFAGFSIERVADFDERDVERLLGDAGIIRHRGKIEATIGNAVAALELPEGCPSSCGRSLLPPLGAPVGPRRVARDDARVDRALEGAQAARLPVRRADDGLRLHAVGGLRRRPPRRLFLRGEARESRHLDWCTSGTKGVTFPSNVCR